MKCHVRLAFGGRLGYCIATLHSLPLFLKRNGIRELIQGTRGRSRLEGTRPSSWRIYRKERIGEFLVLVLISFLRRLVVDDEAVMTAKRIALVAKRELHKLPTRQHQARNIAMGCSRECCGDILLKTLFLVLSLGKDLRKSDALSRGLESNTWNALSRTTLPQKTGQRKDKERWMRNQKEPRITLTSYITTYRHGLIKR
jgi:hypothetical protein